MNNYGSFPTKANSCFFKVDDREFALSLLHYTDMGEEWTVQLHEKTGGVWKQVGGHIAQYFNNFEQQFKKFKNTSEFIKSHFHEAEKRMRDALAIQLPNKADPAECTAYDIARDVEFKDGRFQFNKPLPLSHNLLP